MTKKSDDYGLGGFGGHGGAMGEGWVGAGVGALAQSGGAALTRAFSSYSKWSEAIGAVAGLAVGGVMYAFDDYKEAGKVAMVVAAVNGVVRTAEVMLRKTPVTIGMPVIENTQVLRGHGFGIATIEPTHAWNGASPQLVGPPQLVGADSGIGMLPSAQQVRLEGGPAISGLAGMYGATLFGGN